MTTKPLTKTKKKVNIDGKQQKVDHNVYLVLQNLTIKEITTMKKKKCYTIIVCKYQMQQEY